MKKRIKQILTNSLVVSIACVTIIGTGYVFAAPTTAPSTGVGVSLPLTVGPEAQTKAGDLTISGTLAATTVNATTATASTLNATTLCIAGDCQTEWPSTSAGTLQSVTTTASVSNYQSGGCYAYTYNNGYTCGTFGISVNVTLTPPEGAVLMSAFVPSFTCLLGYTQWRYGYQNGVYGYYGFFETLSSAAPTSTGVSITGSQAVISASCPIMSANWQTYSGQWLSSAANATVQGSYLSIQDIFKTSHFSYLLLLCIIQIEFNNHL